MRRKGEGRGGESEKGRGGEGEIGQEREEREDEIMWTGGGSGQRTPEIREKQRGSTLLLNKLFCGKF